MKTTLFKRLPLSLAVGTLLVTQTTWAQEVSPETNDETSVAQLDTLQVTADRQGAKIKTNVVTTRFKDERTETDLRGLLKEEPAIAIGGGNGTSQYFAIRGMGQNSIDLKVDNAYSDSQILYHQGRFMLDPALVKIVSVQKGAGAASAGIGATNGAIVAKTLDANDLLKDTNKNHGIKLNAGYGSNSNAKIYGVQAFGRVPNFDFLLSANRIDEDNYKLGEGRLIDGENIVPYSALDKRGYLAKAGADFGNHRLVLSHMREEHLGDRLVREEFAVDNSPNSRLTTARQAPAYRKTTLDNSNIEYKANSLGFVSAIEANAYILNKERYSADDSNNGYAGKMSGETTTHIATKGANLNLDIPTSDTTFIKTGVNFRHQQIEPNRKLMATDTIDFSRSKTQDEKDADPKNANTTISYKVPLGVDVVNPQKTDVGVYVESIAEIDDVTATLGLRYDYFEFTAMDGKKVADTTVSPSLGFIWQPTASLSFNLSHNHATRSPRLYDALLSHGNRGITSIADDVRAETARNSEIGFNFDHKFANNSALLLSGSYFWQKIHDAVVAPQNRHQISSVEQYNNAVEATKEIKNSGYITNQGYELGASYSIAGLTAKAGVSDSEPQFHGVIVNANASDVNPEFAFKLGRTWTGSLAYRFNQPNLEVGVRNRTVEAVQSSVLAHVSPDSVAQRDAYSVTDVFANWKPYGNDMMNVNFAVNNIMDKYYYAHAQRAGRGLPAAGRDFRIAVNYKF